MEDLKLKLDEIRTTEKYWDCECKNNYIHSKYQKVCPKCSSIEEEQPDSRINEVLMFRLPL